MIDRLLAKTLESELAEYPVVTVFGPRQSGKTTLVRACCPNFGYVSMEDKETRDAAAADYKSFFVNHPPPLIIDEVQRLPEIVASVQTIVDSKRHLCGQFILTGSQQTQLAEAVDESLAGRTSILDLLPLSAMELQNDIRVLSTDECLTRGFMPELYSQKKRAFNYYRNYFRTYVERDVRRLVNVKNLLQFERFVTFLAGGVFLGLSTAAAFLERRQEGGKGSEGIFHRRWTRCLSAGDRDPIADHCASVEGVAVREHGRCGYAQGFCQLRARAEDVVLPYGEGIRGRCDCHGREQSRAD